MNIRKLSESDGSPIAMATGYLKQYQSMVQVRQQVRHNIHPHAHIVTHSHIFTYIPVQVVVVLLSDWTVLCLNHELKLLWKVQPLEKQEDENLAIRFENCFTQQTHLRHDTYFNNQDSMVYVLFTHTLLSSTEKHQY